MLFLGLFLHAADTSEGCPYGRNLKSFILVRQPHKAAIYYAPKENESPAMHKEPLPPAAYEALCIAEDPFPSIS